MTNVLCVVGSIVQTAFSAVKTLFTLVPLAFLAQWIVNYAGNIFVNYIARWDGSVWQPLGNGISNHVYALTMYKNLIAVGGRFTVAGAKVSAYLALRGVPLPADLNCDDDVNLADFAIFAGYWLESR